MHRLILLAGLFGAAPAVAADQAFGIGAHAGVMVFDEADQLNTSWYATPRIGFWFTQGIGLELDVGFSTGQADATGHGFFAMLPSLNVIGDPIPREKNAPVRPIVTAGGGMIYKVLDDAGVRGADYASTRLEGLASFGTGLIVPIVGPLSFRTDVRMLVTAARENDQYRYPFIDLQWTAGLEARFLLAKDTDKDKIPDREDLCINDPEDMDAFEDEDGCPELDNDSDGVPDADDGCPLEAEDIDGFEDADGCPDTDNDDDGLLDAEDECPDEPGVMQTGGCPDRDGDLVADKIDECPDHAGPAELKGCPDTDGDGLRDVDEECPEEAGPVESFGCPDRDADRVPDYRDACPDKPVSADVDPLRSDGCPSRVYVTLSEVKITETIQFDTGKASIRSVSNSLLDDIAKVLIAYPTIHQVQVEGHTDSQGSDDRNLTLSQARAESVVAALVARGVEGSRLFAKGFGETKPVGDNATAAGRAQNRRVAFTILDQATEVVPEDEVPEDREVDPTEEPVEIEETQAPAGE